MNRGERAKLTKAAKRSAKHAERRAALRMIRNHRDMLANILTNGEGKSAVLCFADRIVNHLEWGWHREERS